MIGKIKRILLYLFISSFLYVLITKFVDPPITITQLTNAFGLGLKRDYVSWEELGYQSKLAAIASEDQLFAEHIGFDFDAIEKSLRPKKKKKKVKFHLVEVLARSHNRLQKMFFCGKAVHMINTSVKFLKSISLF